jgi:peptidoglycan/LPS O-acetylase OafA/YrhL
MDFYNVSDSGAEMIMNKKIRGFDGLRGIAVLLVFIEHFVMDGHDLGGLGVRIFFVLSGFLIIGILHSQRERIDTNQSSFLVELKIFWGRRVRRIFPIYYLTLTVLLIKCIYQSESINTEGLPWYFIFASNLFIEYVSLSWASFSHLWSISVEQHFYMFFSPVLLFFSRKNHQPILMIIFAIAMVTFFVNVFGKAAPIIIYVSSIINFAFMTIGGFIAIKSIKENIINAVGVMALVLIPVYIFISASQEIKALYPMAYQFLCHSASLIWCASLIKYVTLNQYGLFVSLLEWPPLRKLGEISYGFYIYHYFVPRLPQQLHTYSLPYPYLLWALCQFILTVAVAWISWVFIEQRFMQSKSAIPGA